MDSSSSVFGEECHSSESGWTMYICSSIHGDDNDDNDDRNQHTGPDDDDDHSGYDDGNGHGIGKSYNDDSDDSMASDASSGPSNQRIVNNLKSKEGCKGGKGRTGKQETERRRTDRLEKDQERGKFMARRGNIASGQSGLKTRKSFCGWRK